MSLLCDSARFALAALLGSVFALFSPALQAAAAPAPVLVKDINVTPTPYFPGPKEALTPAGNRVFFATETDEAGSELWTSDGTVKGTQLVKDINSGVESSWILQMTADGNRVFFAASTLAHGRELWVSDGTEAGTRIVADLRQGPQSRVFNAMQAFRKGVVFFAQSDNRPFGLWWSDGTEAGTRYIKELPPGVEVDDVAWYIGGNYLYIYFWDTTDHRALWRTDGTTEGTLAIDIPLDGTYNPGQIFGTVGTSLYFWSKMEESPQELWKVDGATAKAAKVIDLPGWPSLHADPFMALSNRGYFQVVGSDSIPMIWSTDGTTAGTAPTNALLPDAPDGLPCFLFGQQAIIYDQTQAMSLNLKTGKATAFFSTQGTEEFLDRIVPAGNKMYLVVSTANAQHRLFTSNGTAAGTKAVGNVEIPGLNPASAVSAGTQIFFPATLHPEATESERLLWKSNGTPAGTIPLQGPSNILGSSTPAEMTTTTDGITYFAADDGIHDNELWRTDGTPAGTVMVKNIYPEGYNRGSDPLEFLEWNGHVYFSAEHPEGGRELWRTDGTEAGTHVVRGGAPNPMGTHPSGLTVLGSHLHFFTRDFLSNTISLWRTDGTDAGTVSITTFPQERFLASKIVKHNGRLFFILKRSTGESALYSTDGTYVAGPVTGAPATIVTHMSDLCLGPTPGFPEMKSLYFRAMDTSGNRLNIYRVNPDGSGFTRISAEDIYAESLNVCGDALVYSARPAFGPYPRLAEIFVTDGSLEDTQSVASSLGTLESFANDSGVAGDLFYYGLTRVEEGHLHYSFHCLNVRTKTVILLKDGFSIYAPYAQVIGDTFFFGGSTETVGGLWQSQGTPESTRSILSHGLLHTWGFLAPHKRQLLISGQFDSRGYELFSLDLSGGLEVSRLSRLADETRTALATNAVIDFGSAAQGSIRSVRLRLDNRGLLPLEDLSVTVLNGPFVVQTPAPSVLQPSGQAIVEINFAPMQTGSVQGQLLIAGKLAPDGTVISRTLNLHATSLKEASAPVIGSLSSPQIIRVGESATFAAQVFSSQPVTAHLWKRGSTKVGTEATLTLASAQLTDAGVYTYSATNASGTGTSPAASAALLAVLPPLPDHVSVFEDGVLTLACTAVVPKGGKFSYLWYHNGFALTDRDTFKGTRTAKLTVSRASFHDTGFYHCRVTLTAGSLSVSRDTIPAEVSLVPKPTLTEPVVGSFVGQEVSVLIEALNSVSFSAKGLPPGLKISSSGLVTGRATLAGTFLTTVSAKNDAGTRMLQVPWTIHPGLPAGVYDGLISLDGGRATQTQLGSRLMMVATVRGTLSGRLVYEGKVLGFAGTPVFKSLDEGTDPATVQSELIIRQGGKLPNLTLLFEAGPDSLTARLSEGTAALGYGTIYSTRFYGTATPATAIAGNYVWHVGKSDSSGPGPVGHGFATAAITPDGMVNFQGRMADGTAVLGSSPVLKDPLNPDRQFFTLRHYLYPSGSTYLGSYGGEVTLTQEEGDIHTLSGSMDWKKAALSTSKDRTYREGIPQHTLIVQGVKYLPPAAGALLLGQETGANNTQLTLTGPSLPVPEAEPMSQLLTLTDKHKATFPAADAEHPVKTLTFDAKKGTFKGTLFFPHATDTKLNRTATFEGVILSGYNIGAGFFLLPELPAEGQPASALKTTPIPSGLIRLEPPVLNPETP